MKFTTDKKRTIMLYLLEKIEQGESNLSATVADAFGISRNTVHSYMKELADEGIIQKEKRDCYRLVTKRLEYTLKRSNGELSSDTYAYDCCLAAVIAHLPESIRRIWSYSFSEMTNNVMDHSSAEHLHVVIEQNYLKTSVALMDDGVGIFKKIKQHFSLSDLDEAICELFKGKLTTDPHNHSGEGIFFTSKMMDSFFILSDGKIFATTKYENSTVTNLEKPLNGTCVLMSLSNFTHKQAHEIFDLYASDEGGFNKTRIPLKNVFDTAPVSRSQAKRICHRLDQFSEVILDFDGLSWMGQGFAHQLFVVYVRANPGVSLTPINMCESVESMYRHVTNTL